RAYAGASYRRPGLANRPARSARLRDRRTGLGRTARRGSGSAKTRSTVGAGAHEHLALHRLRRQVSSVAAPVDDLAWAVDRSATDEALQGAVACGTVGNKQARDDGGGEAGLSSRVRRTRFRSRRAYLAEDDPDPRGRPRMGRHDDDPAPAA